MNQIRESKSPPSSLGEAGSEIPPLVSALQGLYRSYQKRSIYPPGHPAIPVALEKTLGVFDTLLPGQKAITIGVARDHLSVDNEILVDSTGALESLARLLHDLDTAVLEFDEGLTLAELDLFVTGLGQARLEVIKGEALVSLFDAGGAGHFRLLPIDYSVLDFKDGVRESAEHSEALDVWDNLTTLITKPDPCGDQVALESLACKINEGIMRQEGIGLGLLRQRIRQISRDLPQRADGRSQLASFVGALNPTLRSDLLRVDPVSPSASVDLVMEMADLIPEPDLLEALQRVDAVGARVPGMVLTLMNKLVHMSEERPSLASGLDDTLKKWGVSESVVEGTDRDMRTALAEVFQARQARDYNPATYQAQLDGLTRNKLQKTCVEVTSRYRDPRDLDDVTLHDAELAIQVLIRPGGEQFRPGLLARIDAAIPQLLRNSKYEALRDVAVAAKGFSDLGIDEDDTKRAAVCFLNGFQTTERILQLLAHAIELGNLPEPAIALLRLGEAPGIRAVLHILGEERADPIRRTLQDFLVDRSEEDLADLLANVLDDEWPTLEAIFTLIDRLPEPTLVPWLEKLTTHAEQRVRREALLALCRVDTKAGAVENHLRKAVIGNDPGLVLLAITTLGTVASKRSIAILTAAIEGRLQCKMPTSLVGHRAAHALMTCGPEGIEQLCNTLNRMCMSLIPRKIWMSEAVADILYERKDQPKIQACLKRWRFSPAGLINRCLPRSLKVAKPRKGR